MAIVLTWERFTEESVSEGDVESQGFGPKRGNGLRGKGCPVSIERAIEWLRTEDSNAQAFDWCYVSVWVDRSHEGCFDVWHIDVKQRPCWPVLPIVERSASYRGARVGAALFLTELAADGRIGPWDDAKLEQAAERGYL